MVAIALLQLTCLFKLRAIILIMVVFDTAIAPGAFSNYNGALVLDVHQPNEYN